MATRFQEASSTVTDLIQKSHLICEGPPAQYRLITDRKNLEQDGSVGKWTFGQRDRQTKIILMVGESRTGKTTLINAMVNYILGVKFTDEVWFEITEERGDNPMSARSKSKTTNITVYEVFVQDNQFSLTIIDTPGYGDTRGSKHERQIAENLNKLFHNDNGVKEIDAVCLVASKYLSNGVLSLFGKDLENNIVIMVTHSDGIAPDDALSAIKKAGIPFRKDQPDYFLFNNLQTVKRSPNYNTSLQTAWEQTECGLKKFFASLKEHNRKSLEQTKRVLTESRHLQACFEFVEYKAKKLAQSQKALEENQKKIKRNESLSFTAAKYYKDYKAPTRKFSFQEGGGRNKYVTGSKDMTGSFNGIKNKYESSYKSPLTIKFDLNFLKHVEKDLQHNRKMEAEKINIEKRLNEDLIMTGKEKANLVEEAYTGIIKLFEIALKPDSAFMVHALDFLISQAEETGRGFVAQKLRELTGLCTPESSVPHAIMASRFQEASLPVNDLIWRSTLISEGQPSRYRLITDRKNLEQNGSVRKWTFGQRDNQSKILLMVGETGTGKTTLINAMVNYLLGVKFTDEVWFEITEEGGDNPISDQSKSQTSKITVYEVFVQDNQFSLTIIDTPGYGDTRGREYDRQIAENLNKLFHSDSGVKEIDAVCLVVKASQNRLTDRQQYIFDALLSLFGKDIENNIVIMVTHSDGMPPEDALDAIMKAGIPARKDEENQPEHFLFNNRQTVKRSPNYNRALQAAWEQTEGSLKHLFASLKEQNRKSLKQTESVLTESRHLEACITNLQNRIHFVECKTKELAQIQKVLQENREKIKRNKNFTFTVTEYYKEKVPIRRVSFQDRKATICTVCEENCHEFNCWCSPNALWCKVIKLAYCTVCTGKCHFTKHVRGRNKYVTRSKDVIMTFDQLKNQYESNNKKSASNVMFDSNVFENVKKDLHHNRKEAVEKINIEKRLKEDVTRAGKVKADLVEEAYTAIIKLSEIALKPDSAFIVQALDFLIPQAEETGRGFVAQKLRELRNIQPESQERVNAVMGYTPAGFIFHV